MIDLYQLLDYKLIDTIDDSLGLYWYPYILFNAAEAAVWIGCAIFIAVRNRMRSTDEWWYALSFFCFGLSDVIELSGTTMLLLLFKLGCIIAIIGFRKGARARHGNRYL